MTQAIIEFFRELLGNDYLTTFIISIIPIVELRGAVPVAFEMGMSWWQALGLAYCGSVVVVPILLLLLTPILNLMKRIKIFARLANAVEDMFKEKAAKIAKKAGGVNSAKKEEWIKVVGIFAFVALPLPLTGVWTGAAIAVFLGMPFWKALGSIMLGNLAAGLIVTLLCIFFKPYLDTILMVFFILVLVILALFILRLVLRMVKSKKKDKADKAKAATVTDLDTGNIVDNENAKEITAESEQSTDATDNQPDANNDNADKEFTDDDNQLKKDK